MKKGLRVMTALLCLVLAAGAFSGCGKKKTYNNEEDALTLMSEVMDGVFNPFYYTSANDGNVVNQTQLSMLSTDEDGNIVVGENEPTVTLDWEEKSVVQNGKNRTQYTFVLKNNIVFSDGVPMTMKDVLFNFYVYLDPAYTGSSTLYSTDIVGLKTYRTQTNQESQQDNFEKQFESTAENRISALISQVEQIIKDKPSEYVTDQQVFTELGTNYSDESYENTYGKSMQEDYDYIRGKFREELVRDFEANRGTYEDLGLDSDIEAFLFQEGLIVKKNDVYDKTGAQGITTKEQAIEAVYQTNMPQKFSSVMNFWVTGSDARTYYKAAAMERYFEKNPPQYRSVEGIEWVKETATVNGKAYTPLYDNEGNLTSGNEILRITIENVDPKAIWNFGLPIAPMHYYSSAEQIAAFDGVNNFGVKFSSVSFMDNAIKGGNKINIPLGAGPYKASTISGGTPKNGDDFKKNDIVYLERNENFVLGSPKIKKLRYKVINIAQAYNEVKTGGLLYATPQPTVQLMNDIKKEKHMGADTAAMLGYGYLGINAGRVPNIKVRRAIIKAINTQLCIDYYPANMASTLLRPMSKVNWAYPKDANTYVSQDTDHVSYAYDGSSDHADIKALLTEAGYSLEGGKLKNASGEGIKLTFTVAGGTTDHPAFSAMQNAATILNSLGCEIEVKNSVDALSKLSSGSLDVWTAAWSSTIDPDMYQVYHKDSNASSTLAWGYREIKSQTNKYAVEWEIIKELSEFIDAGRLTTNQDERKVIYAQALDKVMELAVELPLYQRNNWFVYNTDALDVNTMTAATPYNDPLARIWEVSFRGN